MVSVLTLCPFNIIKLTVISVNLFQSVSLQTLQHFYSESNKPEANISLDIQKIQSHN